MEPTVQLRAMKKYKKGNIAAAFGVDLFINGTTAVSNLLLKVYHKLGITDSEMMLIIQLFRMHSEEKNFLPSLAQLDEVLSASEEQIRNNLESLISKEMLKVTEFYDMEKGLIIKGYDFEPLFEKLSELWACAKVRENDKIKNVIEMKSGSAVNLYKRFEKEFGRPLSPMEVEQIDIWSQKIQPNMVLEALRRAVLMGKHNFKYIDSILLEWEKNNICCLLDLEEFDRRFKAGAKRKKEIATKRKSDVNGPDKKSLIKSLYMN